jgi:hypothetical protein
MCGQTAEITDYKAGSRKVKIMARFLLNSP